MRTNKYNLRRGSIAAIRLRMGLTQAIFALELGISRSLLSKVENRTRSLPTPAIIKLAALEMTLAIKPMHVPAQQLHFVEGKSLFANKDYLFQSPEQKTVAEVQQYETKLERMAERYQSLQQSLCEIELLIGEGVPRSGNFPAGYLKLHRYKLQRKLNNCRLHVQYTLQHKLPHGEKSLPTP